VDNGRILAIWCQWRKYQIRMLKIRPLLFLFGWEGRALIVVICFLFFLTVSIHWGGGLALHKFALDWYNPDRMSLYQSMNMTSIKTVEMGLAIFGLFLMERLPDDLKIGKEYHLIVSLNFFVNWYFELSRIYEAQGSKSVLFHCAFNTLRDEYLVDTIRSGIFSAILLRYSRYVKESSVPTSLITSLYDFCHDPLCRQTFQKYLHARFPTVNTQQFQGFIVQLDRGENLRESVYPGDQLEEVFNQYMHTKSFQRLRRIKAEEERVASIAFTYEPY